ncbi:hypothetical protein [Cryobacterium sp. Hh38]|uniref:hypothetical protein n=1 Tax=Cryobacterium sp. Hh38 TaxID=1259156 RepID=UPI001069BF29|nr:hypothetical protein [Cryobacterium sp. Hh38]TFD59209.1 hypothetical protein E3T41_11250 [Cryobacterium sp. Hh38]
MRNPPRRRPVHRTVLTAAVLFLAGTLSGCLAAPVPPNTTSPVAEATAAPADAPPIFASNDEALAAAEAAYTAYLSAGDTAGEIGSDSWNDYLALTTGRERDGEIETKKELDDNGWRFTGTTSFDSMTVQSFGALSNATWEIKTYVCLDVSQSQKVDTTGQAVSDPNQPTRWPLVVVFYTPDEMSNQLLIAESTVWSGSNFC